MCMFDLVDERVEDSESVSLDAEAEAADVCDDMVDGCGGIYLCGLDALRGFSSWDIRG